MPNYPTYLSYTIFSGNPLNPKSIKETFLSHINKIKSYDNGSVANYIIKYAKKYREKDKNFFDIYYTGETTCRDYLCSNLGNQYNLFNSLQQSLCMCNSQNPPFMTNLIKVNSKDINKKLTIQVIENILRYTYNTDNGSILEFFDFDDYSTGIYIHQNISEYSVGSTKYLRYVNTYSTPLISLILFLAVHCNTFGEKYSLKESYIKLLDNFNKYLYGLSDVFFSSLPIYLVNFSSRDNISNLANSLVYNDNIRYTAGLGISDFLYNRVFEKYTFKKMAIDYYNDIAIYSSNREKYFQNLKPLIAHYSIDSNNKIILN